MGELTHMFVNENGMFFNDGNGRVWKFEPNGRLTLITDDTKLDGVDIDPTEVDDALSEVC